LRGLTSKPIWHSVDTLEIGHSIHIGALPVTEGVSILDNEEQTVVVVNHPKSVSETESEEETEEDVVAEATAPEEE